jgi:hypothetical protein
MSRRGVLVGDGVKVGVGLGMVVGMTCWAIA